MCFFWQVTGKALILDEIINYVQSLQNQVEVKHQSRSIILVLKCCTLQTVPGNNVQIISPHVFSVPFHEDCLHEPSFIWFWTGQWWPPWPCTSMNTTNSFSPATIMVKFILRCLNALCVKWCYSRRWEECSKKPLQCLVQYWAKLAQLHLKPSWTPPPPHLTHCRANRVPSFSLRLACVPLTYC